MHGFFYDNKGSSSNFIKITKISKNVLLLKIDKIFNFYGSGLKIKYKTPNKCLLLKPENILKILA